MARPLSADASSTAYRSITEGPQPLKADWQHLMRTFIRPENEATRATLLKYMEQILFGLHDFIRDHVGITEAASLRDLSDRFRDSRIPDLPAKKLAEVIADLIENVAPHAVNVASPYFIGHMTSAIPFFMIHLKTIVAALNQNVVKLETSKVVSVLEKEVLSKLHRLIFDLPDTFYETNVQNVRTTLGGFVEDGTLANLTALWVARNRRFASLPSADFAGIEADGLQAAFAAHGVRQCVVLVSRLAHYSLKKAGGILGIGNRNVVPVDVDAHHRMDPGRLRELLATFHTPDKTRQVIAVVGIAGTTETGTVDPLPDIADICAEAGVHFHVDAAWGGPTLMSSRHRHLLAGIERADSVTIDGHKQFYMPMTCGMIFFRDPEAMDVVTYHARYINRPGSVDLGIKSLSGSREAVSLILDSALKIMGKNGYALLIDHGIDTARQFADEIRRRPDFELTSEPVLNILTYRMVPRDWRPADATIEAIAAHRKRIDRLNEHIQRLEREAGKSFVSRTTLRMGPDTEAVVLRCVLMNPLTTPAILGEILDEQQAIADRLIADQTV